MLNKENRIWWFMFGALAMMALVLYVGFYYVIPAFKGERSLLPDTAFFFEEPPALELDSGRNYRAVLVTNYGDVTIDLFEQNAPLNVNNFVFLSRRLYYRGTKFHRLVPGLILQGGDRNTLDDDLGNDGKGGPGYFVADEVNWDSLSLSSERKAVLTAAGYSSNTGVSSRPLQRYSLAMASGGPNTNGSQFFIMLSDDARIAELQGRFTVIGTVTSGFDVLNRINGITVTDPASNSPRPLQEVLLRDVTIL